MPSRAPADLSRRERQIMDVLYRLGRATANEVIAALPDERHSSTVRTQLRLLESKGHIRREADGLRYLYMPAASPKVARKTALKHLVDTFFAGSTASVIATLLNSESHRLSQEEVTRLSALIEKAGHEARTEGNPERSKGRADARDRDGD